MPRYIEADRVIASLGFSFADELVQRKLDEQPTADVVLVKRGKWIFSPDHAEGICTNCSQRIYGRPYNNTYVIVPYRYCPHCGAKMEVEDDG